MLFTQPSQMRHLFYDVDIARIEMLVFSLGHLPSPWDFRPRQLLRVLQRGPLDKIRSVGCFPMGRDLIDIAVLGAVDRAPLDVILYMEGQ